MSDQYLPNSLSSSAEDSGEVTYSVPVGPVDATIGAGDPTDYYLGGLRATAQVRALLSKIPDKDVGKTMNELVAAIEETAHAFLAAGHDIQALPPVRAFIAADSSVSLEWTAPDFRLGFNIERDPRESGWYFVTTERLGEIGAYGSLSDVRSRSLVSLAMTFALVNS